MSDIEQTMNSIDSMLKFRIVALTIGFHSLHQPNDSEFWQRSALPSVLPSTQVMFSSIAPWQNHIHLENNYQTFSTNFFARIFANCGISIPNVKSWFNLRFVGVKPKWPLPEPITSLKLFCRAQNHIVENFLDVCVLFHSKPVNACELRDFWWETRISGFRNIKYRIWHCCRTYKYSHYIISKIRCERFSERMVMAFLKRAYNFSWLVELRLQPWNILFWKCGEDTPPLSRVFSYLRYMNFPGKNYLWPNGIHHGIPFRNSYYKNPRNN